MGAPKLFYGQMRDLRFSNEVTLLMAFAAIGLTKFVISESSSTFNAKDPDGRLIFPCVC